jgi:single-strand DNA-binding protein
MASFSKIIIVGNVGRDPELKMTPNGRPVCEFSVAVNRVSGRGEERVEATDWYRVSCWSALAERAQQMITKGRLVLVDGRFTPRSYTDREGKERYSLDISANDFQMLDPRPGGRGEGGVTAPVGGDRAPDGDKSGGFDPDEIPF